MLTRPPGRKLTRTSEAERTPHALQSVQFGLRIMHNTERLNQGCPSMVNGGPFRLLQKAGS